MTFTLYLLIGAILAVILTPLLMKLHGRPMKNCDNYDMPRDGEIMVRAGATLVFWPAILFYSLVKFVVSRTLGDP